MERLAHRLASGVPDGDVERAQRTVQQTARAHPVTASRQPLPGRLRFQDAHADQVLAELARGVADRRHEIGARIDDVAETFDAIGGRDSREDVPVRIDRSPGGHVGVSDGTRNTFTATCVIFTLTPGRYAASAGTSASRRPKAGSRSELLSARSIAQNDAWFVVTIGFLNSRSQAATDDMVGKLPPGTTKASISGRSTLANASRAF